jgi:nicotinate-nucleotide pyrophosphorylase (carboxylating)
MVPRLDFNNLLINDLIELALREDLLFGDITTDTVVPENHRSKAYITAKSSGIIAGLPLAEHIFKRFDPEIEFIYLKNDGDKVQSGENIAIIEGQTRAILKAERTVLNFLQRLSGIATRTYNLRELVRDLPVRIVDTRKTTPGHRILEKYAVRVGGGQNHRMGLFDAVLIKDNHIEAAGSITQAVKNARTSLPHTVKIEVETETLEQVQEALDAGADIIMLDNMDYETMRKAVEIINGRAIVEASGGINEQTIRQVAETGVNVISIGSLTHSVKALDISLNIQGRKTLT